MVEVNSLFTPAHACPVSITANLPDGAVTGSHDGSPNPGSVCDCIYMEKKGIE
jgi:hypothetical protein